MNNQNKIMVIFFSLSILLLVTVGISYAYFTANAAGETGTTIEVTGGKMTIEFNGGENITIAQTIPSANPIETKYFTVTGINTTELDMGYSLYLVVTNNTFDNYAIQYKLNGQNPGSSGTTVPNNTEPVPIKSGANTTLLGKGTFGHSTGATGKIHTYSLEIYFADMPFEQNINHERSFNARIHISEYSTGDRLISSLDLAEKAKKINMYQYMAEMVHKEYLNKVNILDSEALGNLVTLEENYHDAASSLREQINATEFLDTEIPREKVESITFIDTLVAPNGAQDSVDVSESQNGSVMLWYKQGSTPDLYEITIGQTGGVRAPIHSDFLFAILPNLSSVSGTLLTNDTKTMSYMFTGTGYNTMDTYSLNLSGWNTSNVTDMSGMFSDTGNGADEWEIIGINGWNVSNVADMSKMFNGSAQIADSISLNLSWGENTSNVTDMSGMFTSFGLNATAGITLTGINGWNTSKVTNMAWMFSEMAKNTEVAFNLNLNSWNTSNVTDMSGMFYDTATETSSWSVGTLAGWNIAKVNNLSSMFYNAGASASTFILNLSGWNTGNATLMSDMFFGAGYDATNWSIDGTDDPESSEDTDIIGNNWQVFKLVHSKCDIFSNISLTAQASLTDTLINWGC